MKRAASVLAAMVVTFLVGCQSNTPTGPAQATDVQAVSLSKPKQQPTDLINPTRSGKTQLSKTPKNAIPLYGVVRGWGRQFDNLVEIIGRVEYSIVVVPRDPPPHNPQYGLSTMLSLNATLRPFGLEGPTWDVAGVSHDDFGIMEPNDVVTVVKKYAIPEWSSGSFL